MNNKPVIFSKSTANKIERLLKDNDNVRLKTNVIGPAFTQQQTAFIRPMDVADDDGVYPAQINLFNSQTLALEYQADCLAYVLGGGELQIGRPYKGIRQADVEGQAFFVVDTNGFTEECCTRCCTDSGSGTVPGIRTDCCSDVSIPFEICVGFSAGVGIYASLPDSVILTYTYTPGVSCPTWFGSYEVTIGDDIYYHSINFSCCPYAELFAPLGPPFGDEPPFSLCNGFYFTIFTNVYVDGSPVPNGYQVLYNESSTCECDPWVYTQFVGTYQYPEPDGFLPEDNSVFVDVRLDTTTCGSDDDDSGPGDCSTTYNCPALACDLPGCEICVTVTESSGGVDIVEGQYTLENLSAAAWIYTDPEESFNTIVVQCTSEGLLGSVSWLNGMSLDSLSGLSSSGNCEDGFTFNLSGGATFNFSLTFGGPCTGGSGCEVISPCCSCMTEYLTYTNSLRTGELSTITAFAMNGMQYQIDDELWLEDYGSGNGMTLQCIADVWTLTVYWLGETYTSTPPTSETCDPFDLVFTVSGPTGSMTTHIEAGV